MKTLGTATLVITAWIIGFSMSSEPTTAREVAKTIDPEPAMTLRLPEGAYEIQRDLRVYVVPDPVKLTEFCHQLAAYYKMPPLPARTVSCASVASPRKRTSAWMVIGKPGDWTDQYAMLKAGHELWHVLGEKH